ncbi:MAG TPA: VOC family protein [Amycolatopsis sp.]|uniref:VOC family protein n=1 Tax=Amycolatopsis sp. TaxID=37632 RepID=UPI002B4AA7BC|nr:VOC family protein [Amycolatopsis sp.]HKS45917.1 VOC family protein [Amycolatopsis sp.]
MPKQLIFVNLPARDLAETKKFWSELGFSFNPQFTDENAGCLVVSDTIFAMLLAREFFANFTGKEVVDATKGTETIIGLSAETREAVDTLVDRAVAAGATEPRQPMDHGFMYQRSFDDLDGHQWEIIWMDPDQAQ